YLPARRPPIYTLFPYTTLFRSAFTATAVTVPDNAQLFGKLMRAGQTAEELIFLTTQGISVYQPATDSVEELIEVLSIYRAVDAKDRKSTRLNSSHVKISYAVFC